MNAFRVMLLIVSFSLMHACSEETVIFYPEAEAMLHSTALLRFNGKECFADDTKGIMKFSLGSDERINFSPLVKFQAGSEVWFNSMRLKNNEINSLGTLEYGKGYPLKIISGGITKEFKCYFTSCAILKVVHVEDITDAPKSLARIYVNDANDDCMFDSYVGIEVRGNFSLQNEKKSYGFSLLKERDFAESYSDQILGMNKAEAWVLDAVYNDPAKMRNSVCIEIWQNIFTEHAVETNIQFRYIELFENYKYQGIYVLTHKLNPQLLNISNTSTVLYKADARFGGPCDALSTIHSPQPKNNLFWDGWSQVNPENKADWDLFHQLRETLINGSDEEFSADINHIIDLPAFIDYFIFINLCGAWDNTGSNKNLFLLGKSSNTQLTVIPWDMDLTFGVGWSGTRFDANTIIGNKLYSRLEDVNPDNYRTQLKNRWQELRNATITPDNLYKVFKNKFDVLEQNKIQSFDNDCWNLSQDYNAEAEFIRLWIEKRIMRLDSYFANL